MSSFGGGCFQMLRYGFLSLSGHVKVKSELDWPHENDCNRSVGDNHELGC